MIRLQPTPNDFQNSFNSPRNNLDLTNTSLGNFSQIPSQNIPSSMYQTAASSQYQSQPSFVYGNQSITYTSNTNHSRTSSAASFSRQSPTDGSFGFEANGYSQLNYNRYDQSTNTGSTMNSQPDVKASSLDVQQNQTSPHMIPSSATSSATLSPDSGLKVLPPLSEVFPQTTTLSGQSSNSTAPSPTQSHVVQVQTQQQQQQQQQQQAANAVAVAAAQNGFFQSIQQYPDAASYTTEGATYGSAPQGSLMSQAQQQSLGQQAAALSQQSQIASNIPVVDPRTLPRLGPTASDLQQASIQTAAMLDPSRRGSNAILAINTGLTVGSEQSPLSAGSSTGSPIVTGVPGATLNYQHPAAAHQALLNSHFMAAAQSMNNSGMLASSHRALNGRKGYRTDDDMNSAGDRPQKVYSFVALPGINTKKRPRRRYDEIERHYACNFPGCTKSYGTLNHLNAHVQMQKHGQKRHPSEFKELRKQWRRQKREEEERKAAEAAAAKNPVGINISLPSI